MKIDLSYEKDFDHLLSHMKQKYGESIFELEGIGSKQLDLNRNAKSFLESPTVTADVSVDANANVDSRDVIGYQFELPKPLFRLNSLYLLWKELRKSDPARADMIIDKQISGSIYINDFSDIGRPYCFNYSTYDIVLQGLPMITKIKSVAPKCLYSFKSQVEQFIIVASNSTLGATGLADLFICMALYVDKIMRTGKDGHIQFKKNDHQPTWDYVKETIVSLIYTLNQPMRGNQSPFTNISLYDTWFLRELCPGYTLDGKAAIPAIVERIQDLYMEAMNEELRRTPVTFPVTTACFSVVDGEVQDRYFMGKVAEANLEWGFINIYLGETSTLSSCCRLRSSTDNEYFNSFGAGSTKIGSLGVVTLNLPRMAWLANGHVSAFRSYVAQLAFDACHINNAKRNILKKRIEAGNMPLYTHGHMDLSRQYSTIGVTGLYEAMEILGHDITKPEGTALAIETIGWLNRVCDEATKMYKAPHNLEQVPAESSAVKLASKDRIFGYNFWSSHNESGQIYPYYSNQFIPLTAKADMLDRIRLQGVFDKHFSGGAICHINVEERLTDWRAMATLIELCARKGVVYWAVNYVLQECANGHLGVGRGDVCDCGSPIVNEFTRVVGFLTNVKNWNKVRRVKDYPERQFYGEE